MPYLLNQQLQAWHEGLEMIFNIVVRFNILFHLKKRPTHSQYRACSRLYIYIYMLNIKWNTTMQLNNVMRFEKWIDGGIVKTLEIEVFGHRWKYKRKLLSHIIVQTMHGTSLNIPIVFIPSFSFLSLTCLMHSSTSTSTDGKMRWS
jgi:hypothetical protein